MLLFLAVAAAVFFAEHRIKAYIRSAPAGYPAQSFFHDRVRIQHVENQGFSASRLKDRPEIVQPASVFAVLIAFFTALPRLIRSRKDTVSLFGMGLLFGGSLSNLLDRTFRGSVTDYLHFPQAPWAKIRKLVFNLADLCIFLGAAVVLLRALFPKRK